VSLERLLSLAAAALETPAERVREAMDRVSFTGLGGSSLQAVMLSAAASQSAVALPLSRLLGRENLGTVLREATSGPRLPAVPSLPAVAAAPGAAASPETVRPALPSQQGVLQAEEFVPGSAYHLLFTAQVSGATPTEVAEALGVLVARHEGLRTVFARPDPGSGRYGRRVLRTWAPDIFRQVIRPAAGSLPLAAVNAQLGASSTGLLRPFERPPVCFAITEAEVAGREPLLMVSVLAHHAMLDGWAIGVLFTQFAELLSGASATGPAPSPELVLAQHHAARNGPEWRGQLHRQVERLAGAPLTLELPTDLARPARQEMAGQRLDSTLSRAATLAWRRLSEAAGCTPTAALLAAYALALGRRAGSTDLIVGVPAAGRDRPELQRLLTLCSSIVPVRCRLDDAVTGLGYVCAVAEALAHALDGAGIPFDELVAALRPDHDRRRNPVAQFALGVHDDLIPETIRSGRVELQIAEGHCGGAPLDATLYLQRGGDAPRLVLEYATSVLTPAEAADLLDGLDATLIELADGLTRPLSAARAISAGQQRRLDLVKAGAALPASTDRADLWSLTLAAATAHPDAPAVRSGQLQLTYSELVALVRHHTERLYANGVRDGDPVLVAVPRSVAEPIAVLAVLALGAHYVAVEPDIPDARLRRLLALVPPVAAVVGTDPASTAFGVRAARAAGGPLPLITVPEPESSPAWAQAAGSARPAVRPDGDRVAYLAFTSGSTGVPKAVRVPHRAVARLVLPGPQACVQAGPGERILRLAPLAFDASTLELFAPLAAGGCLEIYPSGPVEPVGLARFLVEREITVLWLTAGLFRLMADYALASFAAVSHVLTGGDVVPPEPVRALLSRYPGLRVSNGYGPTENTTFSTIAHFDDPAQVREPLPIGQPVAGSGVAVLDRTGGTVPPGGIGELYVTGLGLALDYASAPDQTAAAFSMLPGSGGRAYRTGDLVRLDGDNQLRYLGRRDRQVKIRGFRVELDEIRRILLDVPGVREAVVMAVGTDALTRRLLAALLPVPGARPDPGRIAAQVASILPGYAVPALWAVVDNLPLTANGKVDQARLTAIARPPGDLAASEPTAPAPDRPPVQVAAERDSGTAEAIADEVWAAVLGRAPAGPDSDFFRSGGDSLALAKLIALLGAGYGVRVAPRDLYTCPTLRRLTELIRPALPSTALGAGRG